MGILDDFRVFEEIIYGRKIPSTYNCNFLTAQSAISWASEHITDTSLETNLILWFAFFGLDKEQSLAIHIIEALSFKLTLKHQLRRISSLRMELSDEAEIRWGFEKIGISLSKDTSFEYHNGKLCIVDDENAKTYVYGHSQFYGVQTPNTAFRRLYDIVGSLETTTEPSAIYQLLKPLPLEAIVLAFCDTNISETQRINISDYLLNLRLIKPIINGDDLIEWDEKPGKNFEYLLKEIFYNQLDGKIKTKSDGYTRYQQLKNQERD